MSILVKRSRCFCDRVLYSGVRITKGETEELFTKKYVSNFLLYTLRFKKRLFNFTLGLKKDSLYRDHYLVNPTRLSLMMVLIKTVSKTNSPLFCLLVIYIQKSLKRWKKDLFCSYRKDFGSKLFIHAKTILFLDYFL